MKNLDRSLLNINKIREAKLAQRNKKIFADGLNQRAGIRQKKVIETIMKTLEVECDVNELDLCKKEISFEKKNNLSHLYVNYHSTNTLFFSRLYDLIIKTSIPSMHADDIKGEYEDKVIVGASFSGRMKATKVMFRALSNNDIANRLADRLNKVDLLLSRVLYLEAFDVRLEYNQQNKEWEIGLATPKGSVVWNLLPPVMMSIKFTKTDAIKLIELFQLMIAELYAFESCYINDSLNNYRENTLQLQTLY